MLKYQALIDQASAAIGVTLRDKQPQVVNQCLVEFLDNKMDHVILDAPTGTGKSIIGAVVAEAIGINRHNKPVNALMLSSTNILLDQYGKTFPGDSRYLVLKGADNYICPLKSHGPVKVKASTCIKRTKFFKQEDQKLAKTVCDSCEFLYSRKMKNVARNVITNYAFYFLDRLFIAQDDAARVAGGGVPVGFERRNVIIWDEAHMINDAFVNHCSIFFSKERADEFIADCERHFPESVPKWMGKLGPLLDAMKSQAITMENLAEHLKVLASFYAEMRDGFDSLGVNAHDYKSYLAFFKLYDKYKGLFCKINNYFTYDFEVVIDGGEANDELKVTPIFMSGMFEAVRNSEFNLFMSATVSKEFLVETLSLDPNKTAHVRAENVFNLSDKRVVASRNMMLKLNYAVLKDDDTYRQLGATINNISNKHSGESGLIFAPSFAFIKRIKPYLKTAHELVLHESGALADHLRDFKKPGAPKILFSPSIYEGVDLPGDLSRFQVLTKAPYFSLGDKRMAYILKHHPEMYQILTIMRVVQGIGRSTRYKGDNCTTYFLDTNLLNLFNSYHNIWQDQFLLASSA